MDFSMFENMKFSNDGRRYSNNGTNNDETFDIPKNGCDVDRFPEHMPLAMSYTPMQQWGDVYGEEEALSEGTIFPELNMPFEPEGGCYGQR